MKGGFMATLRQVIDFVEGIKPSAYSEEIKTEWINEIEGAIQSEIFLFGVDDIVRYDWETCADHELLVRAPYHEVYYNYLYAKIDFANSLFYCFRFLFICLLNPCSLVLKFLFFSRRILYER